eukprot:679631-Rhodomonas_salina.5
MADATADAIELTAVTVEPSDCPLGAPLTVKMKFKTSRAISKAVWDMKVHGALSFPSSSAPALAVCSFVVTGLRLYSAVHGGHGFEKETHRYVPKHQMSGMSPRVPPHGYCNSARRKPSTDGCRQRCASLPRRHMRQELNAAWNCRVRA